MKTSMHVICLIASVALNSTSLFAMGKARPQPGDGYLPPFDSKADSPLNCQVQLEDVKSGERISTQKSFSQYIDPVTANPEDLADSKNFRVSVGYYPNEVDVRVLSKDQKLKVASSEIGEMSAQFAPQNHQETAADGSLLTDVAEDYKLNVQGKEAVLIEQFSTDEYRIGVNCRN